jgi:hypothetical protein
MDDISLDGFILSFYLGEWFVCVVSVSLAVDVFASVFVFNQSIYPKLVL